jgi:hypothetical protein
MSEIRTLTQAGSALAGDGALGSYSIALNGAGAYATVPNSASLNITGAVTVEAWVNTNTDSGPQPIIERYTSTDGGYALRLSFDGHPKFYTLANGGVFDTIVGGTIVTPGVWHHIAGVFDPVQQQLRVYLDGVLDGSKTSTFAPAAGTGSVKIGARGDDAFYTFNGLIDEARITPAVVYSANFSPSSHSADIPGTAALWTFDDQLVADYSGNGNHGTLVGGAAFSTVVPSGTVLFNQSCGMVHVGDVSDSCDANFAPGTRFDQPINVSFAAGNRIIVEMSNIDDHEQIYVNGMPMPVASADYGQDVPVDITQYMIVGNNSIRMVESNDAGPWCYGFKVTRN